MDPFYPCMKYKKSADPKVDGTDYFIVAESMHVKRNIDWRLLMMLMFMNGGFSNQFNCFLSFTCENDKKAFYKLIKDCLRF